MGGQAQPLTAPAVMPATIRFWKMITASTSGIVMITTDAALMVPSGISNFWLPVKFATDGTVNASGELVSVTASRNSFQTKNAVAGRRDEAGRRERQHDLAERLEVGRPVDERRLLELLRDLLEERGEDVDRERQREGQVRGSGRCACRRAELGPQLEDGRGDRDRRERRDRQDHREEQELRLKRAASA